MSWARRLKFRHLETLIHLSDTGSLSETARLLHTTQPGLSKWLRELEEEVGGSLFERHARGIKPTVMGVSIVEHARRLLVEVDRTQRDLDAIGDGDHRVISVGTSPASAPSYVPMTVCDFLKKHPRTRVEIIESTMDNLLTRLQRGRLDVVVGRLDNYQPNESLICEMLYHEPLKVVARPQHPLTYKAKITWDDLYDYEWVVWPQGSPIRSKLDYAIMQAGKKPLPFRIESSSQMGNLWILQHTDMLSIGSERVVRSFTYRGLLVPLDIKIEGAEGPVGMVRRDNLGPDKVLEDLLKCFREQA